MSSPDQSPPHDGDLDRLTDEEMRNPYEHLEAAKGRVRRLEGYLKRMEERLRDYEAAALRGLPNLVSYHEVTVEEDLSNHDRYLRFRPTLYEARFTAEYLWDLKDRQNIDQLIVRATEVWARSMLEKVARVANPRWWSA